MISEYTEQKEIQIIVFQIGKEEYAVPITNVQEIIMPRTATHIPRTPSFVEGVINLRGRIIPVIDGRKKFGLEANSNVISNESRIMVLDVEQEIIGLIVDSVSEVVHLQTADIVPSPVDTEGDAEFLEGVGKFNNRLLILINPQKFLSGNEVQGLQKLTKLAESLVITEKAEETIEKTKEELLEVSAAKAPAKKSKK